MKSIVNHVILAAVFLSSATPTLAQYDSGGMYGSRSYDTGGGYVEPYRYNGPRYGYEDPRDIYFNERVYLRCNPDVKLAIKRGHIPSGRDHWETFGRREGRRLNC